MTETTMSVAGPANVASRRIMIDAVNWRAAVAAVRAGRRFQGLPVSLVAGYVDGRVSQWPTEAWKELAAAGITGESQVAITVLGGGGEAMKAQVDDSEPGNNDPAAAASWAHRERVAGHWPVIYTMRSWKKQVLAETAKLGLHPSRDFGLWIATLDGTTKDLDGSELTAQPGMVAVQVEQAASPVHVAGQPLDLDVSVVCSTAWRVPKAPPPPKVLGGYLVVAGQAGVLAGRAVQSRDGGKTWA